MKKMRGHLWIGFVAVVGVLSAMDAAQAALTTNSYVRGDKKIVLAFTAGSGTWTVPAGVNSLEVLVVGGGAGGSQWLSGAGAGGFYYDGNVPVAAGNSVTVTVGTGGLGYGDGTTTGIQGSNSVFGSLIAYGGTVSSISYVGGAQGGYSTDGGSTIIPGIPGVTNVYGYLFASGSGAGASGTPDNNSAAGGAGKSSTITGSTQWYAGGGGGPVNGPGGSGIGGTGATALWGPSGDAVVNTGSGGGGSWGGIHGAGGSGIVIIAFVPPPTGTLITIE